MVQKIISKILIATTALTPIQNLLITLVTIVESDTFRQLSFSPSTINFIWLIDLTAHVT